MRPRDIDYAAVAVKKAIEEKFGAQNELGALRVVAGDSSIAIQDGDRLAEGTRDQVLIALRASATYAEFWENFT